MNNDKSWQRTLNKVAKGHHIGLWQNYSDRRFTRQWLSRALLQLCAFWRSRSQSTQSGFHSDRYFSIPFIMMPRNYLMKYLINRVISLQRKSVKEEMHEDEADELEDALEALEKKRQCQIEVSLNVFFLAGHVCAIVYNLYSLWWLLMIPIMLYCSNDLPSRSQLEKPKTMQTLSPLLMIGKQFQAYSFYFFSSLCIQIYASYQVCLFIIFCLRERELVVRESKKQ